jgi:uncharacterized protein CbrC (UPF0167 family)
MTLPTFPYHPDPLDTGSVVPSDVECRVCGRARGYVYAGSPYAEEELEGVVCPWCIADGSAAGSLGAEFVDADGIGGHGRWDAVPETVVEAVSLRTPGFSGWQQEQWWTHCGDAAAYLGPAGRAELEARWPEAIAAVRAEAGYDDEEWREYFRALDRERGPTAYVFRCRHCGQYGAYSDVH